MTPAAQQQLVNKIYTDDLQRREYGLWLLNIVCKLLTQILRYASWAVGVWLLYIASQNFAGANSLSDIAYALLPALIIVVLVAAPFFVAGYLAPLGVQQYFASKIKDAALPDILKQFGSLAYFAKAHPRTANNYLPTKLQFDEDKRAYDLVEGTYRGHQINIVETYPASTRLYQRKTFGHILIIAVSLPDVAQGFAGRYALLDNSLQTKGRINLRNHQDWQRIRLESTAFESRLDFYGPDQIEGRKLFTPRMIEHWETFTGNDKFITVDAMYSDKSLFLKITRKTDLFDHAVHNHWQMDLRQLIADLTCETIALFKTVDVIIDDLMPDTKA